MYEVYKYVESIIILSSEIENFDFVVETKSDSTTSKI